MALVDEEPTDDKYVTWIKELDSEESAHKDFRKQAKEVEDRYSEEEQHEGSRFNILWSNTETIHAAVYAKSPEPDVRRRYKDADPVGRDVAEVIERALSYCMDAYPFDDEANNAIRDYLVPGLGQIRLRYVPYFEKGEPDRIPLYEELSDDAAETKYFDEESNEVASDAVMRDEEGPFMLGDAPDEIVYEEVTEEYVPYSRFRWQAADRWQNVMWCAIDHFLTKKEVEEQFGEDVAKEVPYGFSDSGEKLSQEDDGKSRALFHEIFDKKNRKIIILCRGHKKLIQELDDPLELQDFYPFPKPLMATTTSGKLTPKPDYLFYQDQALELDRLTQRIEKLTDELKYRGVYDGSFDKLADIADLSDGEFAPIDDFMSRFDGKASIENVIKTMPLQEIMAVLTALHESREKVKQTIYEITGIADIVRGQSKASETLGAQKIKGEFATMRIDIRRNKVASFLRDLMRIKAEIICEHFTAETLSLITGKEVTPEMKDIMESDALRSFRVDIETDSTVQLDAEQQQKNRIDLITSITGFMEQAGPAVQAGIMPLELAKELILFGVRSFKEGRQLEDALEQIGANNPGAAPGVPGLPQLPPGMPAGMQDPGAGGQGNPGGGGVL